MAGYEQRVQGLIEKLLETARGTLTPAAAPVAPSAPKQPIVYAQPRGEGRCTDKAVIVVLILVALLTGISIGVGLCFFIREEQDRARRAPSPR